MKRQSVLKAFALLVLSPGVALPAVIFTNMPGMQFGPDGVGVGAIPVPGVFLHQATNFIPAESYQLTSILLPVGMVSGPSTIEVSLYADSGNSPGSVLETFHIDGLPVPGPVFPVPLTSTLRPVLQGGQQYWIGVTGGSTTTFAMWALMVFAGDPAAGGATRTILNGVDQGWTRNTGTRSGAVEVDGLPIPEPAAAALAGAGLCGLLVLLSRRPG